MGFSAEQKRKLDSKLDPAYVKSRDAGRSGTLSYIEGWHAIAEANRIFGFDAWDRQTDLQQLGEPEEGKDKYGNPQWRVRFMAIVTIRVRANGDEVVRQGTGYGSGIARDVGDAYEGAVKEAETDAMKRALMTFGNPFGLALYDKKQEGVGIPEKQAEEWGDKRGSEIASGAREASAFNKFKEKIGALAQKEGRSGVEEYWFDPKVQARLSAYSQQLRDDAQAYYEEVMETFVSKPKEAAE